MTMGVPAVAHLLAALVVLLAAAHTLGTLCALLRQPRVVGEIAAGLVLGPTLLGQVAPRAEGWLFPATGGTPAVLGAIYQLGLLLLLFCSGTQIRSAFQRAESRTVSWVFVTGMLLPLLAGLGLLHVLGLRSSWGPRGNGVSFLLVFAIAMAVTSIPVISKIMHDLGILDTAFARVVLGVAVAEDVVLYVVLAVAVGVAQGAQGQLFGLPSLLRIGPGTPADMVYHVAATVAILAVAAAVGPRVYRATTRWRLNLVHRASPVAYQLLFLLTATLICLSLGVEAIFGALVAGIAVGAAERSSPAAARSIEGFAFAFFIPIYFALVGLQLDLLHGFSVVFFLLFLLLACAVKAGSVYLGARLAGEATGSSLNLAVALNARGGPGIVVASVAYTAGIIDQPFYAVLVLLAIVTSLFAGSWLAHVPRERLLTARPDATGPLRWRARKDSAPRPADP